MVNRRLCKLQNIIVLDTYATGRINDEQKDAYQHLNIVGLVGSIE